MVLFLGREPFGSAAPSTAVAIMKAIASRLRSSDGSPTLAFIGDNDATLEITGIRDGIIACRVLASRHDDPIVASKGVGHYRGFAIRGIPKELSALTEEDREKIEILLRADYEDDDEQVLSHLGISFCQRRDDVEKVLFHAISILRTLPRFTEASLDDLLIYCPALIAKIETELGFDNREEILDFADGLMIARGDLALEMETARLPEVSKIMTSHSNLRGKSVIMATQMLESMKSNIECSRPEAADVFNAVADGADALLLSGETSSGRYPALAVEKMMELAFRAESFLEHGISADAIINVYFDRLMQSTHRLERWAGRWDEIAAAYGRQFTDQTTTSLAIQTENQFVMELCRIKKQRLKKQYSTDRITHAACTMAADEGERESTSAQRIRALVSPTKSGRTTRMLARFRPRTGVTALPHVPIVARKLQTSWGVRVLAVLEVSAGGDDVQWLMRRAGDYLLDANLNGPVVFTCGAPLSQVGTTNMVVRWDANGIPHN